MSMIRRNFASVAYGDSCKTGTNAYVLAQFRADANLGWVQDLRSLLDVKELKFKHYDRRRHEVAANRRVFQALHAGIEQAEITIIDRPQYQEYAYFAFIYDGADPKGDFDIDDVNRRAAFKMIWDSPLGKLARFRNFDWFLGESNSAPASLIEEVQEEVGGKLNDAVVLAARSHAMLTPSETWELIETISPFGSKSLPHRLNLVLQMRRTFDTEHAKSVPVLNRFVEDAADAIHLPSGLTRLYGHRAPVVEESSHTTTHIQAADFAAGWAADMLISTNRDYRTLARKFCVVIKNGVVIPESES
jgi:hypothetical protein